MSETVPMGPTDNVAFYIMLFWIVLIVVTIAVLVIKYPLGKWDAQNPNPYVKETLAIPRGVFRSILTLSLLFAVLILEIRTLGMGSEAFIPEKRFEQLMTAFQMVVAFYFGGKMVHHVTSAEKETAIRSAESSFTSEDAQG